jgi:uncharacterized membrane protein
VIGVALALHLLAATIWVGGMFFAWVVLRPAALQLDPPQRLRLWAESFQRFFPWVWAIVILLPLTGLWLIFRKFGGMGGSALYVHVMLALGIAMTAVFLHVWFAPYRRLRVAVDGENWQAGAAALASIRRLIGLNLILGLATLAIVGVGQGGGF